MKNLFFVLFCGLLLTVLSSCASNWTAIDIGLYKQIRPKINKVQFATSDEFLLTREIQEYEDTKITIRSGKIEMVDGKKTQRISFPYLTKGVFLIDSTYNGTTKVAIRLEALDDSWYLTFGESPKMFNEFTLMMSRQWDPTSTNGQVTYGGYQFQADYDDLPKLMVKKKIIRKNGLDERTASGVKITKRN